MDFKKIVGYSTHGLIWLHVLCCGLPLMAALLGLGVAIPFIDVIPHEIIDGLMVVATLALIYSWVQYFRGCECHKKLLIFSTILFATTMVVHFIVPLIAGESCH